MGSRPLFSHRQAPSMAPTTTFLFLTIAILFSTSPSSTFSFLPPPPSYSYHCNDLVPESTQSDPFPAPPQFLQLTNAYVQNADQILPPDRRFSADFSPYKISQTLTPGILKIDANLRINARAPIPSYPSNLGNRRFRVYGGTKYPSLSSMHCWLSGFWSSSSGQLCMVGSVLRNPGSGYSDSRRPGVVLKMKYPMNSTISSILVTGSLESMDPEGSSGHFRSIHVMGFAMMNYEYGAVKSEIENGWCAKVSDGSLSLPPDTSCLEVIRMSDAFELEYGRSSCDHGNNNCSQRINGLLLGRFMSMNMIDCPERQTMRVIFRFSNTSRVYNGYLQPFDPSRVLVAEGAWNADKSGICFVGCRISGFLDSTVNASIRDCSYRLSFVFPSVFSIRSRSVIAGQIWSNKSVTETGSFDRIGIRSSGFRQMALRSIRYEYTETERAAKYCTRKAVNDGKVYHPDHRYTRDMKFDVQVKNNKGQEAFGHASPLFVDGQLWQDRNRLGFPMNTNQTQMQLLNVSYQISFNPRAEFQLGSQSFSSMEEISISTDGILDIGTGLVCMVGCRRRRVDIRSEPLDDCQVFISIQFPSPNSSNKARGELIIKGTINSKREKTDPLYFEQLELSSSAASLLSKREAVASIWRMDLEIIMALMSNTLMCIFVVLQLFHLKKHPDALPFVSIVMLTALALGHMIPLLLNFEAFLSSRRRQSRRERDVLFGDDTWVEVDQVLVRVITMIAFLLECRLLQLTWLSRGTGTGTGTGSTNESQKKGLWVAEKKVVSWCFPLFIGGLLIAWLLHPWRRSSSSQSRFLHLRAMQHRQSRTFSLWGDLKSYGGFILDCFLLPQIMFNAISDAKEKAQAQALSPPYYFGITAVRLVPHLYDLFRAHASSVLKLDLWYMYANPGFNYYSTAWDIIISCCGLGFVVVLFLQQKLGGRWFLPRRFKERFAYQKVPIASSATG
ncbi:hypothetical protein Dimus_032748 [Dionaea muscipula]